MNTAVTPKLVEQFKRDGAVLVPGVIDDNWLDRLKGAIERDIANPGPYFHGYGVEGGGRFHGNMRIWENDPDFRDYCWNSPLPELAAQFLNADKVNLFYDQLFVKEPSSAAPTRWHNDQPYWPVRGWPVMSFWLALDPVTHETGALEFVKGSHQWDRWFQPEPFAPTANTSYASNPDYEPMPDIDAERDQHEFLSWDMQPGDVIAFHAMAVHGAPGNSARKIRRRGYTVRYTGPEAYYYLAPGMSEPLIHPDLSNGEPLDSERYPVVWPPKSA